MLTDLGLPCHFLMAIPLLTRHGAIRSSRNRPRAGAFTSVSFTNWLINSLRQYGHQSYPMVETRLIYETTEEFDVTEMLIVK